MPSVDDLVVRAHDIALKRGFYDNSHEEAFIPSRIAHLHEEISEILQAWKHSKYKGMQKEIVDTIIRLFDFYGYLYSSSSLKQMIVETMLANESREYLHGKRS